MEIGQRLKEARGIAGLTQELVAEEIGVSRQTISNWENNKSYPDIISVIRISDLYSISLDALLKEDKNMIRHLDESTNTVRSYDRLRKSLPLLMFLVIWAVIVTTFWLGGSGDAMGFSIVTFYLVLPVTTIITAFFVGKDDWKLPMKAGVVAGLAVMNMLAEYGTFSLANMLEFNKINMPEVGVLMSGVVIAAIGLGGGCLARVFRCKKEIA